MTRREARLRLVVLFATALVGLLGAHVLGYVVLAPEPSARAVVLAETGHGYLSRLTEVAVAAAILAGLASARLGMLRARRAARGRWSVRFLALRLFLLQGAGFVALEVVERALTGAPIAGLAAVLVVGFPIQALVAGIAAALIGLLERAGEAIGRRRSVLPSTSSARLRIPPPARARPAGAVVWVPRPIRGPPASLGASS